MVTPSPVPSPEGGGASSDSFDIYQFLGGISNAATALAVVFAIAAAWIGVRQLRVSAETAKLTAVLETNQRWRLARDAQGEVRISQSTLTAVVAHYESLGLGSVLPAPLPGYVDAKVPKILGVLQPANHLGAIEAPSDTTEYNRMLVARSILFGSLMTHLRLKAKADPDIERDLNDLTEAVVHWVNQLNELAEMYGESIIDRRLLIGKVHIDLSRAIWYVEPYILWRNTTYPGRWGLRLLAFGQEAREYHWKNPLQNSPVMEDDDIGSLGPTTTYQGFCNAVGWMYGSGGSDVRKVKKSERQIKKGLGTGFTGRARTRQYELVSELPCSEKLATPGREHNGLWETLHADDPRMTSARSVVIGPKPKV